MTSKRKRRPEPPHPEDSCQDCGGPNVVWFAPNDLWNAVFPRGPNRGPDRLLCPVCFIRLAERAGLDGKAWEVKPKGYGEGEIKMPSNEVHLRRNKLPLCNFQKRWASCEVTSTTVIASVTCKNCLQMLRTQSQEIEAERAASIINPRNNYGRYVKGDANGK